MVHSVVVVTDLMQWHGWITVPAVVCNLVTTEGATMAVMQSSDNHGGLVAMGYSLLKAGLWQRVLCFVLDIGV